MQNIDYIASTVKETGISKNSKQINEAIKRIEALPNKLKIYGYRKCPSCGATIAMTPHNKDGLCPYFLCKSREYTQLNLSNEEQTTNTRDSLHEKYIGKQTYSHECGDILTCISIINEDMLQVVSAYTPVTYALTSTEFESIAKLDTICRIVKANQREVKANQIP